MVFPSIKYTFLILRVILRLIVICGALKSASPDPDRVSHRPYLCLRFGHLADPRKKQVENEVHLLVNTRIPRTSTNYAQTCPHKYHQAAMVTRTMRLAILVLCLLIGKSSQGVCVLTSRLFRLFLTGPRGPRGNRTCRHKFDIHPSMNEN